MKGISIFRLGLIACTVWLVACKSPSGPKPSPHSSNPPAGTNTQAECACVEYPFPKECETQCGMTEFIVKQINPQNNTVEVTTPQQPSESRTIPLSSLDARQMQELQAGSHIQVLFKRSQSSGSQIKPLRVIRQASPK
jgi:hypothetical protein